MNLTNAIKLIKPSLLLLILFIFLFYFNFNLFYLNKLISLFLIYIFNFNFNLYNSMNFLYTNLSWDFYYLDYSFLSIFKNYIEYPFFFLFAIFFLLTTIFSLIFLSYLGLYGVFILNLISLIFLWLSLLFYIPNIFNNNNFYFITLGKWMYLSNNFKVTFDFLLDITSISFALLTLTIAVFVYIYTFSYFRYEPLVERLILMLNGFIISMVFLVCSGNFIMLFLGWEMIGLTSFFLINFWASRVGTLKAAFKAYSFNKVSDLFLFFAIILIYNTIYSLDILTFNQTIHLYNLHYINFFFFNISIVEFISFFFLICAFIKSAQFGAHIWLPDSMEAPVPASALIHSATLVSAGIYLLLRLNPLFEVSYYSITIITFIGSITCFYGGLVSMYQSDTKRILAYSTISHCGFLMIMYTTGVLEFVILYLYVHGFFKAATFLCVGNVIRFSRNVQDFKRMGLYFKYLPFDCFACFICLINLGGLPLTFGFYIKHLLFVGFFSNSYLYWFLIINFFLAALTGLFYSSRLFYNVFFDFKKSRKILYSQANRKNLNSSFYSNTTLASNLSIFLLIIVSYFLSFYLFYSFISFNNFHSDISRNIYSSEFISLYYDTIGNLLNYSLINWVVLSFILFIIFTTWRKIYTLYLIYDNFFRLFLFLFFFLVNYICI